MTRRGDEILLIAGLALAGFIANDDPKHPSSYTALAKVSVEAAEALMNEVEARYGRETSD